MREKYPSDWECRRKKVYQRDNYTCQNCGATGGPHGNTELHAHHVVPKSEGGSNQLKNLQTLCRDCHNAIHYESKVAPTARINKGTNQIDDPPGPLVGSVVFGSLPCLFLFFFITVIGGVQVSSIVYVVVFMLISAYSYRHKDKWHRAYVEE